MHKIKPRIDDNGVPWCDNGCPHEDEVENTCGYGDVIAGGDVCPHAVRRMAVEIEAWRSGTLSKLNGGRFYVTGQPILSFNTIDDAIDALMAERED